MSPDHEAKPPSPWDRFLKELDALLRERVEVHCIGGFVVRLFYGLPRPTGDVDYYPVLPYQCENDLQKWAGPESMLAKKYKLHLHHFTAISLPENYATRLVEMYPGRFEHLCLYALDPYDLILSKLERNGQKDRDDVGFLAGSLHLSRELLCERYRQELRPYLTNESRRDLTPKLGSTLVSKGIRLNSKEKKAPSTRQHKRVPDA
jgi:hypothetical protein